MRMQNVCMYRLLYTYAYAECVVWRVDRSKIPGERDRGFGVCLLMFVGYRMYDARSENVWIAIVSRCSPSKMQDCLLAVRVDM